MALGDGTHMLPVKSTFAERSASRRETVTVQLLERVAD